MKETVGSVQNFIKIHQVVLKIDIQTNNVTENKQPTGGAKAVRSVPKSRGGACGSSPLTSVPHFIKIGEAVLKIINGQK